MQQPSDLFQEAREGYEEIVGTESTFRKDVTSVIDKYVSINTLKTFEICEQNLFYLILIPVTEELIFSLAYGLSSY